MQQRKANRDTCTKPKVQLSIASITLSTAVQLKDERALDRMKQKMRRATRGLSCAYHFRTSLSAAVSPERVIHRWNNSNQLTLNIFSLLPIINVVSFAFVDVFSRHASH